MDKIQLINSELKADYNTKKMINAIIDSVIQYHNFNYLTDWEANHQIDDTDYKKKVADLKKLKEKINTELKEVDMEHFKNLISLNVTLHKIT